MKGIEVIKIFEENGLLASELVDAVYDGLYPVHFGSVLKPHNCLTCIYAEPPAEVAQQKTDPSACHNPISRKYQAGLSYCSHTRLGEANGMVPDAGMEGTCKGGYSVIEDADLLERLKDCEFVWTEVEEYLDDLLPGRHRAPIATRPIAAAIPSPITESGAIGLKQVESVPHFATALVLVDYHRGRGVHELHDLARLVDEEFTGTARLTDEALGRLLPANPGTEISAEGHKRQGHRLRKAYQ